MYQYAPFPTIDMKRTGRRIEHLRKERGLSVRDLQAFFGFESPQAIYKWQWGDCLPSVDNLFALASVLQVPMQDLLVGTDQEVLPVSTQKKRRMPKHPTFLRRRHQPDENAKLFPPCCLRLCLLRRQDCP